MSENIQVTLKSENEIDKREAKCKRGINAKISTMVQQKKLFSLVLSLSLLWAIRSCIDLWG